MKKVAIAAVILATTMAAHATNDKTPPGLDKGNTVVNNNPTINSNPKAQAAAAAKAKASSQSKSSAKQAQGQTQNASASVADSNNASQSVNIRHERNVATAYAPSIHPTVNCAGVVTGGAQGSALGLSFGTTKMDVECQRQEMAKTAWAMGDIATAEEVMCDSQTYRQARERVGRPCAKVTIGQDDGYTGTDPIVRKRLGLAELRD